MRLTILRLVGRLFLAAGLVMLLAAGYLFYDQLTFGMSAARADGVVLDLVSERRPGWPTRTVFAAVVRFEDTAGEQHQFSESISANPPPYARGQRVAVLFDPAAPEKAVIDGFWGRYFLPTLLGGIGLLLVLFGRFFFSPGSLQRADTRYRDRRATRPGGN